MYSSKTKFINDEGCIYFIKIFRKNISIFREYIEGKRSSKVLLITSEDKYKSLFKMLKEISFIEIEKNDKVDFESLQDYGIVMSDLTHYESLQQMEHLKTKVLVFDVDKENIEVGPIVLQRHLFYLN